MRVLVTTSPACGHLFPMVCLAWALRAAGHQVLVATPRAMAQEAARAGLASAVVGGDAAVLELVPENVPVAGDHPLTLEPFAALAERTAPDVVALARAWRPDLIMSEPVEYSGRAAAALLGVPLVVHHWGLQLPEQLYQRATRAIRGRITALYRELGVPDDVGSPAAVVDTCPPSLRPPDTPEGTAMRYVPYNGVGIAPRWLFTPPRRPRIAVAMGTVPIAAGVDGLRVSIAALADLDVEVVVSGAGARSPALADPPSNVRIAGWIPHHQLLPTCDLLVHHGGAGSAMTALAHGLPQLVLPQMADQFLNAERLVGRGVAVQVPYQQRHPDAVGQGVTELLGNPGYREAARGVRQEIDRMPTPAEVATILETLPRCFPPPGAAADPSNAAGPPISRR
jgi:UDP:flavonoid glycosyltransferase YjiC (YdhE family)